jgi:poly(beta-D-mannuronate) lyase
MRIERVVIALFGMIAATAHAAEHKASSGAEIGALKDKLRPGDVVVMRDGVWTDQTIRFEGTGTEQAPITLRAQTPGIVILTGASSLTIAGEHVVVSGLLFREGRDATDGVAINGRHCRLTNSAVVDCTYKFYVHLRGADNRVDHCYLAGKTSESPTVQVEAEAQANRHRIDHNHFGHRPPLRRNGGETIRIGYSWQQTNNSRTLVERNLFERCDGEIEIISSKSCENVYRGNTFLDSAGFLTLRHGDRCVVDANFFLGRDKRGSGGVRIIGVGHTVTNNYIEGVRQGAFWLTAGMVDPRPVEYVEARDCLIAFNTVADSRGPALDLSAGLNSGRRRLLPRDNTIANNVFALKEGQMLKGTEGEGYRWAGNVAFAPAQVEAVKHDGLIWVDPGLRRAQDGLLRPADEAPLRRAADGDLRAIKTDIDGQPRAGRLDVGCDQISDAPVTNRPLTPADVGPSWMKRAAAGQDNQQGE